MPAPFAVRLMLLVVVSVVLLISEPATVAFSAKLPAVMLECLI